MVSLYGALVAGAGCGGRHHWRVPVNKARWWLGYGGFRQSVYVLKPSRWQFPRWVCPLLGLLGSAARKSGSGYYQMFSTTGLETVVAILPLFILATIWLFFNLRALSRRGCLPLLCPSKSQRHHPNWCIPDGGVAGQEHEKSSSMRWRRTRLLSVYLVQSSFCRVIGSICYVSNLLDILWNVSPSLKWNRATRPFWKLSLKEKERKVEQSMNIVVLFPFDSVHLRLLGTKYSRDPSSYILVPWFLHLKLY
jgi:hypothetical protein